SLSVSSDKSRHSLDDSAFSCGAWEREFDGCRYTCEGVTLRTAQMKTGREFHGRMIARRSWYRRGISSVEVLVAIVILALAASIAVPWILHARSAQRVNSCRGNLRMLTLAFRAYHDAWGQFPPAA